MLEVKNLTFQVNENGIERSIVENISFNVEDGEMLVDLCRKENIHTHYIWKVPGLPAIRSFRWMHTAEQHSSVRRRQPKVYKKLYR